MDSTPKIDYLVLDAAPLLALSPLRGLAKNYVTTPQVIAELRDPKARTHFEQLALTSGVNIQVRNPDAVAVAKVSAAAKKSGDFSVLSKTDLLLLSLAYNLHSEVEELKLAAPLPPILQNQVDEASVPEFLASAYEEDEDDESEDDSDISSSDDNELPLESIKPEIQEDVPIASVPEVPGPQAESDLEIHALSNLQIADLPESSSLPPPTEDPKQTPVFEDPPSEDDGEGEWITPDNVASHKAREVFSNPVVGQKGKTYNDDIPLGVACMTADYAMQNVLLHMGLNLVGLQGKRITTVKSWVLRCHACFKLCKDQSKKFCPSCGNPTLLRASVSTIAAPPGSGADATVKVHLKKNFQYRNRGTIYSIPTPKAGNAKGSRNIVLREDQIEFQRGVKAEEVRARKEDKRIASALSAGDGKAGKSWADPDWMPDMLLGQTSRRGSALPEIGYGKRNPNDVRRKKK